MRYIMVAERGSDTRTSELWAQHASITQWCNFFTTEIKTLCNSDMLIFPYPAILHSLLMCGVTLWGNTRTSQKFDA